MIKASKIAVILGLMCALLVAGLPALADPPPTPPPSSPTDVRSSPPDLSRPSRPATSDELRQNRARLAPIANGTALRDVIVSNTDPNLASGGGGSEPSIAINPANPETTATEIENNTINGRLSCSGNVPPPTNDGQPNSVLGLRLGQCSAAGF